MFGTCHFSTMAKILARLGNPVYFSNEAVATRTLGMIQGVFGARHLGTAQFWALLSKSCCAKALPLFLPHNLAHVTLVAPAHRPRLGAARISGTCCLYTRSIVAISFPDKLARKVFVALALRVTICMLRTLHFPAFSSNVMAFPLKIPLEACKASAVGEALRMFRTPRAADWRALPSPVTAFPDDAALKAKVTFAGRPAHGVLRTVSRHTTALPILPTPRQLALISRAALAGRVVVGVLRTRKQLAGTPGIRAPIVFCRP